MDIKDLNNLDVSDLDFNNMGSWPVAAKAVVAALVLAIVVGLGYYLFIKDQSAMLVGLERKEVDFKREFEEKQGKAVNLAKYKEQMATIQESFKTLLQQLPKSSEMASLLDDFSYAATGSGCEIIEAKFLPEVNSEFYAQKPINIVVKGGYHQIANFVSRVSRLPRIVTLHDFDIKITDGTVPSAPNERMLSFTVKAKTYRSDTGE
ncbi:type 4a pilus biogenesis protein PilO [Aliikangiella sp. G2MR2-5]|uniref:type 4a pilus biogenesis protein PilO n=1 Tax=Aliikangiella sp. G2MR2-5 TaxID=2788943 RepID=UPI0018AB1C49|nr:type 4a pilus biogenesis protein PilO [Aliikangiella sp. G2MR2-5]